MRSPARDFDLRDSFHSSLVAEVYPKLSRCLVSTGRSYTTPTTTPFYKPPYSLSYRVFFLVPRSFPKILEYEIKSKD